MKTLIIALLLFIATPVFAVVPWAKEITLIEFESDGSPFKLLGRAVLSNDRIGKGVEQELFLTCTSPDDPTYFNEESTVESIGGRHITLVRTHQIWLIESDPPTGLIQCVLSASFTTDPSHSHDGTAKDAKITIVP